MPSPSATPPLPTAAAPDERFAGSVLALDFGGTHLRTAVVTPEGAVHARRHARSQLERGAEAVLEAAHAQLRESLDHFVDHHGVRPVALGISAPGPLNPRTGILLEPPNLGPGYDGFPLGPRLADALDMPAHVGLDTMVALLAEHQFGAGRGFADLVYLTVSTGVGGSIMTGGQVVIGPDGVAGELGHLTVDMNGPVCGCGMRGHLERMSSGSGMARSALDVLDAPGAAQAAPELHRIAAEIAPRLVEGTDVARAADAGDPTAQRIINDARRAFAAAVVSIVDIFNPDRVIVGGGITLAWGEHLLGPARELLAQSGYRVAGDRAQIVPAQLGDDVGLIGALPLVRLALGADVADGQPELIDTTDRTPAAASSLAITQPATSLPTGGHLA